MTKINWEYTVTDRKSRYVKIDNLYVFYHPRNDEWKYCMGNNPSYENGHLDSVLIYNHQDKFFHWIKEWKGRRPDRISMEELNLVVLKYLG